MNTKRTLDKPYVSVKSKISIKSTIRTRLRIKHEYIRATVRERANSFIYFRNFVAKIISVETHDALLKMQKL